MFRTRLIRGRLIVLPHNATDMDDFLAAFGVKPGGSPPNADTPPTDPPGGSPPDADPPPTDPPPNADPPPAEPPKSGSNPEPPAPAPGNNQAAQAFAQMRIENKKLQNILKGVAGVLGIENLEDQNQIVTALQQKVTQAQAQKQGVPPELLERLQQLEDRDRENVQNQLKQAAYLGFQKVKTQFKLDDVSLQSFADQLIADGINPFESQVNLVSAYIERNFDKIIQEAEARGAQAEMERAAKAGNHSTTPPGKTHPTGGTDNPDKITNVKQLENWFNTQGA